MSDGRKEDHAQCECWEIGFLRRPATIPTPGEKSTEGRELSLFANWMHL